MKKIKLKVVFLAIFFVIYLSIPIFAESIQELEQSKINSQEVIDSQEAVIDEKQEIINNLEQELINYNNNIEQLNQEIITIKTEINTIIDSISQKQIELEEAIQAQEEQNKNLNDRLRAQYMYDINEIAEIIFSSSNFTEQIEGTQIIAEIFNADQETLNELTSRRYEVQAAKDDLENQKIALDNKKAELDTKLAEQEEKKQAQQNLIDENEDLIIEAKAQIALEEEAISIANDKIYEIVRAAEIKAINEKIFEVKELQSRAIEINEDILDVKEDISIYNDSEDSRILDKINQINTLVENSKEQLEKVNLIVDDVTNADTAVDAVERSEPTESLIYIISDNNSSIKKLKSEIIHIEFETKKELLEQAKKDSETSQEDVDELDKNVSDTYEEYKKAADDANIAYDEAQEILEEEIQNNPPLSSWESEFISITGWRWPLDNNFYITSLFGYRIHPIFGVGRGHEGLDIGASTGEPIHACDGGEVIFAGSNGGYGNCTIIQQNSGHQVYYAHQSQIGVHVGQRVSKGEVIGYVGSTGWSTGPHLHLGILGGGAFVDPLNFFPELN